MITANVLYRTFLIRVGASTATAFTMDHEKKQYLVTAAHVVEGLASPYVIEIFQKDKWVSMPLKLTGLCSVSDIAVFAPPDQMSKALPLPATTGGLILGQDVYFLGFPFGIAPASGQLNRGLPFPLVKKACYSAEIVGDKGGKVLLLDGHNNPGFSGGPVVFGSFRNPTDFKIMGVISGYRFSEEPAYENGVQTRMSVRANTGLIVAYSIMHAVDLVKKNPNGSEILVI